MSTTYAWTGPYVIEASDGRHIPAISGNAEYEALVAAGVPIADVSEPLADMKARRIEEAWAIMQARIEAGAVTVTTSAGAHSYGTDAVTQSNIEKALLGVLSGLTPNPRPWTPRGATEPLSVTHDDVKLIAGAIGRAFEAHMQAYLSHKAAIAILATPGALQAYDLTVGWP